MNSYKFIFLSICYLFIGFSCSTDDSTTSLEINPLDSNIYYEALNVSYGNDSK